MKKRFFGFAILFIILLLGGGCMFNRQPSMREAAQLHLEERYGGRFEFLMPWGAGPLSRDTTPMLFTRYSETEDVLIVGRRTDDGFEFRDNYLAVKFRDEMTALIRDIANEVFGESIVIYNAELQTLSPDLPGNATFEEYSRDRWSNIFARIVLTDELFDESLVDKFAEKFQETGIIAWISFWLIDEDLFKSVDPLQRPIPISLFDTHHTVNIRINDTVIPEEE